MDTRNAMPGTPAVPRSEEGKMREKRIFSCLSILLLITLQASAQFTFEEIAERQRWEKYLKEAVIVGEAQPWERGEAVTDPWELTLEKDGIVRKALWKDALGRMKGSIENWKWEIAAYRLDKYLGLNMVPPTVEKERAGKLGSCQLYAGIMDFEEQFERKIKPPPSKAPALLKAIYLQRAFDNLIYNEDRHQSNYRLTEDFRLILIDHSRSFRTTKVSTRRLLYDENNRESSNFIMARLPRAFVEKLRDMTPEIVRDAVGKYLTDKEIAAVLIRRDLILAWLEKRIEERGEAGVLY